ncbi:MAG: ABC transporter ATP-binding protein [Deltaproteobacteria bacterium]
MKSTDHGSEFHRLVRRHLPLIGYLALFGLASSVFALGMPYLSKQIVDRAFLGRDASALLHLSVIGAFFFAVSVLSQLALKALKRFRSARLKFSLTKRFLTSLYSLDLGSFQSRPVDEQVYPVFEVDRIDTFIIETLPNILTELIKLPVILFIAFRLSPPMTLLLAALCPLFILPALLARRRLYTLYQRSWENDAGLSKKIYESMSGILALKVFGAEKRARNAYMGELAQNIRLGLKSFRLESLLSVFSSFASKAVFGCLGLFGGWLIIRGELSLGAYTGVMLYMGYAGQVFQLLADQVQFLSREAVSIDKFLSVCSRKPALTSSPSASHDVSLKDAITVRQVSFAYGGGRPVFDGLGLTIPANSWAGVAGPSGCGKTTLAYLLMRLYDPGSGAVLFDGRDIASLDLRALRSFCGWAGQQPYLFEGTVRENILMGRRSTDGQVRSAAELACLDGFVEGLPEGYETRLGEGGCRLSQGLKQRLALARAVLTDPQLLILDEATSSLDSAAEARIFARLRARRAGKTTIVISHRLFSIKDADRIYFLREGRMEEGSHDSLFSSSAAYREFFANQLFDLQKEDAGQ